MAMTKLDKRLCTLLVKRGLLTNERADEVLKAVSENGKGIEEVLFESGWVTEPDLLASISQEVNFPPIDLAKVKVSPEVLEDLPQDLAVYYGVLPIAKIGNILTLAVSNPFDIVKLDDVETVTGCDLRPVVASARAIKKAIDRAYNPGEQEMEQLLEDEDEGSKELELTEEKPDEEVDLAEISGAGAEKSPVVKLVNLIVYQAIKEGASDIHIEPYEKRLRVRYRKDGVLRETLSPPKRMQNAIVSRFKVMSDMDIAEKRRPQDGKFQVKVDGRGVDFRVSILPVVHGEKVVARILDPSNLSLSLDKLGFEEKATADFQKAIAASYGMVLVTGPTGSGKSTTLYSALREMLSVTENIVTVEEPVEYQLEGVNQVPVNVKRGLTFAAALRSILRQDPDIIMVGEIRDLETVEIAVKAALTGHLVLSTLHTNDAPSTITRMVDMGVDPFMVASSTILVSAQRLARKLCDECKEPFEPPPERLISVGFKPDEIHGMTLFRPKGCGRCTMGYKGRFALLETLPVTSDIARLIIQGKSAMDIKVLALEQGMITLRRCGLLNVKRGRTSIEEVLNATMPD